MKQRIIFIGITAIFIAVIFLVARSFLRDRKNIDVAVKSMDTWQQAAAPLGYPLDALDQTAKSDPTKIPPFDSRMIQLSAFERAMLPTAHRMSAPMGSALGALSYNAQPFGADNKRRGGLHMGDDHNGIGGMDTDLGDPIYAIASGRVVFSGEPSSGWGKTLILAHRTPEGPIQHFMYAHMDQIHVPIGSLVPRSQIIGTVGTANRNYPAHLHLELQQNSGIYIGAGYTQDPGNRIEPAEIIAKYQETDHSRFSPDLLAVILREQLQNKQNNLVIKNATISE